VLALITFFVSVIPVLGTTIIWLPAALWLFLQGSTGYGIFMIIWGLGVNNVEPLVKPFLISKGSDTPFLVIFFGVLGGALVFGFIGVFLGPTVLAVGYKVVQEWGETTRLKPRTAERASGETVTAGGRTGNRTVASVDG